MRLLIVGALEGQLSEATTLAMQGGAKVAHAPSVEIALASLRAGRGADLLLVDVMADIAGLIAAIAMAAFGSIANDSGTIVGGTAMLVVIASLVWLTMEPVDEGTRPVGET
jgi:hypothetical protein